VRELFILAFRVSVNGGQQKELKKEQSSPAGVCKLKLLNSIVVAHEISNVDVM
jgi:hypothetical protein